MLNPTLKRTNASESPPSSQALPAHQGKKQLLHTTAHDVGAKSWPVSLGGGGQAVSTGERLELGDLFAGLLSSYTDFANRSTVSARQP